MRRAVLSVAVLAAALCVAMPRVAAAANVGAEVYGAFNTHGMSDVNDAINAANQLGGSNFNEIKNGLTGGLDVRVWPSGNVLLSAGWEPLFLETSDDASGAKLNYDAQSFQGTVGYFFPTMLPTKFGIAGGLGLYSLSGKASAGGLSAKMEGSGVGFHAMGMTEMTVSPGFAITGALGWRWAKVNDYKIDNVSTNQAVDYSGVMARVGLAFYLPTPTP